MINPRQLAKKLFDSYFLAISSNIEFINVEVVVKRIEDNLIKIFEDDYKILNRHDIYEYENIMTMMEEIVEILEIVYFEPRATQDFDPSGIRYPVQFIITCCIIRNNYNKLINAPYIITDKIFSYNKPRYHRDFHLSDRGEDSIDKMVDILNEIGMRFCDEVDIL